MFIGMFVYLSLSVGAFLLLSGFTHPPLAAYQGNLQ
jgi:hypothetical protein